MFEQLFCITCAVANAIIYYTYQYLGKGLFYNKEIHHAFSFKKWEPKWDFGVDVLTTLIIKLQKVYETLNTYIGIDPATLRALIGIYYQAAWNTCLH